MNRKTLLRGVHEAYCEWQALQKKIDKLPPPRRWCESVTMSSRDQACKTVVSPVYSEEEESLAVKQLRFFYDRAMSAYNDAYAEAEDWIDSLPARQRRIMRMKYLYEPPMTLEEIAESLDLAYDTIQRAHAAALKEPEPISTWEAARDFLDGGCKIMRDQI